MLQVFIYPVKRASKLRISSQFSNFVAIAINMDDKSMLNGEPVQIVKIRDDDHRLVFKNIFDNTFRIELC